MFGKVISIVLFAGSICVGSLASILSFGLVVIVHLAFDIVTIGSIVEFAA